MKSVFDNWRKEAYAAGICPNCGLTFSKAIYMGFPLRICEDCSCAKGQPALWLMEHVPVFSQTEQENGWALFVYEGSYWKGLWQWLTD